MNDPADGILPERPPLRRKEAAAYIQDTYNLPCAEASLRKLATTGGGPAYRKASRTVLYTVRDLDEWARSRIGPRIRSTSEMRSIASASRALAGA